MGRVRCKVRVRVKGKVWRCPHSTLTRLGICRGSQLLQGAELKPSLGFHAAFSQGLIEVLSESS